MAWVHSLEPNSWKNLLPTSPCYPLASTGVLWHACCHTHPTAINKWITYNCKVFKPKIQVPTVKKKIQHSLIYLLTQLCNDPPSTQHHTDDQMLSFNSLFPCEFLSSGKASTMTYPCSYYFDELNHLLTLEMSSLNSQGSDLNYTFFISRSPS